MNLIIGGGAERSICAAHPQDPGSSRFQSSVMMAPFIFPTTIAVFMFGSWIALMAFEPCLLRQTDPKFDCWGSLLFTAGFAGIGATLTWLLALFARMLFHPILVFTSPKPEWGAGLLASLLLAGLSFGVIQWELNVGHIGIQLFSWLSVSFVISGLSLMIMNYVVRRVKP